MSNVQTSSIIWLLDKHEFYSKLVFIIHNQAQDSTHMGQKTQFMISINKYTPSTYSSTL